MLEDRERLIIGIAERVSDQRHSSGAHPVEVDLSLADPARLLERFGPRIGADDPARNSLGTIPADALYQHFLITANSAFLDHERAKAELKALMPEDAKEASGHGVRAKRSKSGAVSFDLLDQGDSHAAV